MAIVEALLARQHDRCANALRRHLEAGYRNIKSVFAETRQTIHTQPLSNTL